ncbi:MAG: hypothetical protein ACXWT3_00290 [Methylococcaceae bacterium]
MNCWICGDNANSGEHKIKASDLKSIFGHVSPKKPLYFHNEKKRNQRILGIKADRLKFLKTICNHCNEVRTQPHDEAWKKLSNYLRIRQPLFCQNDLIYLNKPFPESPTQSMLNVHLYFIKLFGCMIVEHSIPLDIKPFSQSILLGKPHSNVWLSFMTTQEHSPIKTVGWSQVETAQIDGKIKCATWLYIIDRFAVRIMYAEPTEYRKGLIDAWHPSSVGKHVRIIGL